MSTDSKQLEDQSKRRKIAADENVEDLEESRRTECLGNIESIEKEFTDLKEKFFADKIEALQNDLDLIKAGQHQEYIEKCKELEQAKSNKQWAAQTWRDYQLQNIENVYAAECKQVDDEFKSDEKFIKETMLANAIEKRRRLIEEKQSLNLADGGERVVTRTLRKRGNAKEPKDPNTYKRRLNPPSITYGLKESEILEDLNLIQKAVTSSYPGSYSKYEKAAKNTDVYTEKGCLFYHNKVVEKGKKVQVESAQHGGSWKGLLISVAPAEIQVRVDEGTKHRFSLANFRSGVYTLTVY